MVAAAAWRLARTRPTEYGNHLLMSSHNLGLGPSEKKTFIHLQNSIIWFYKCKDKNVLSFILGYNIWGLIALWNVQIKNNYRFFSHHIHHATFNKYFFQYYSNNQKGRKLSIQWYTKPSRCECDTMYGGKIQRRLTMKMVIGHFFKPFILEEQASIQPCKLFCWVKIDTLR